MKKNIPSRQGFALVATISILAITVLLALAMLTLSTATIKTRSLQNAEAEARANARMALMLAIGELQRSMGPDGKVTAPAAILDTDPETSELEGVAHQFLTGVWTARSEALGTKPSYNRAEPFERWLVSGSDPEELERLEFAGTGSLQEPVQMVVSPAKKGETDQQVVYAGKVGTNKGAYAWWVADENTKAHVGMRDEMARDGRAVVGDLLASQATPGAYGIRAIPNFADFPSNTELSDKVISRQLIELLEKNEPQSPALFHDLTLHSESVLANVTDGSLRKDLSLFLERTDINWLEGWGWPEGKNREPLGPLGPRGQIALSGPKQYDVLSWKSLHHWANMHKRQIGSGNYFQMDAMRNYTSAFDPVSNPAWNSGVLRLAPVMTRMQMILSFGVTNKGPSPNDGHFNYDLFMYSYPVLTLWNPYSTALMVDQWSVFLHTLPLEHTIYKNGQKHNVTGRGSRNGKYNWGWPHGNMVMRFGDAGTPGIVLEPGEAKTLTFITSSSGGFHAHNMVEGVQPWLPPGRSNPRGHLGQQRHLGAITARPTDRIEIETSGSSWHTSSSSYGRFQTTFGFRCEPKATHRGHPDRFRRQMFCGQVCWRRELDQGNPVADFISKTNFPSQTLQDLDNSAQPFIHLDVRLKTLDEVQVPNKTWLHTLPAHPYVSATSTQKHGRLGVDNATTFFAHPYTVAFEQINGLEGVIQNRPYFGPSNRPGGRSRIIAQDIPLAPLTSLAQLQNLPQYPMEALNWSGYYFQNHAIGNSFASPGLRPDEIKERSFPFYLGEYFAWQGGDLAGNFYHDWTWFNNADYSIRTSPAAVIDRSYAANHLLFDDYFFSSISTQSGIIPRSYGRERTVGQVAREFFEGTDQLPNPAYRPYLAGTHSDAVVRALVGSGQGVRAEAAERVAANLMVTGGFNVNSTSVEAWTAMLASSHLKRQVTMGGRGGLLDAGEPGRFVVSRFSAPLGGPADASASAEENRWLGYRELTELEIRELAEAIVKQVKIRGPFRSLGEFVNRRLTTDPELARYGALQAALEDPAVSINDNYREQKITAADIGGAKYKFQEAALGSRFQGTPAYISQADILTTIAPVLNARSDTFVIRAYGEARSADGSEVTAQAWCEAVVQRTPDYLDTADAAFTAWDNLTSPTNKTFGRRMLMKTFRWISPGEVRLAGGLSA